MGSKQNIMIIIHKIIFSECTVFIYFLLTEIDSL